MVLWQGAIKIGKKLKKKKYISVLIEHFPTYCCKQPISMAKETMIIFVYDTQMIQKEEDDPATAILYFHPTWVSDQQKAALCGQIMGTIQCIKNIFTKPKIVTLQSGKFFIVENGRYLLAVGTDRSITDWLLKHRATTLYSLINFFHKDFESLANIYKNDSLSAKLYHIFDTYLKMIVFGGNLFSNIPSLSLPKSASNVFIEAIHILQCCQEFNLVLGGSILYHNKVVATQLSSELTKRLVLTDPYRIKCPAEVADVAFDLPLGVQLLQVYISYKEYCNLLESSLRNRSIYQYLSSKSIKKNYVKTTQPIQDTPIISAMKRDQSLIFTAVPEEGSDHSVIDSSVEVKPMKPAPTTPYCGQTSVCSTPMTELKKFVHQNPLSICRNNDNNFDLVENEEETKSELKEVDKSQISDKYDMVFKKSLPYVNIASNLYEIFPRILQSILALKITDFSILIYPQKKQKKADMFKTITDPTFPVFKQDGSSISHSYYDDYIKRNLEMTDIYNQLPKVPLKNNKEHRKSLTLPLKSLSIDSEQQSIEPLVNRRYSSGVQLTPLMSKLSMLAFEERSSGFCSKDTTPCDFRGLTPTQPNYTFPYSKYKGNKEIRNARNEDDGALQKCVLFVCGQQDIWDLCTEHLGKLEKQLNYCMESQSGANSHESEPYSYLCLDSDWDTVKRGGPWGTNDLGVLNYLHRDFSEVQNLMEILIRGGDSIIYGYHCGPSQVYYHESAGTNAGLPPPADPMGLVQLKAKRRLERDHAVILL
ncbi:hypothetical protein NQ314_021016 [Rhamnusium bicolor]|uniref:CCZ1/INTU/HSP4 first Longin domain-containing protein n=1 Tax=Rhamnusium bicolor TaxID=1586634 RepID=A0AAV8WKI2_9CUCU|nr:hypothetical protein NQ314_021016 [Rhamnusium bicolor]